MLSKIVVCCFIFTSLFSGLIADESPDFLTKCVQRLLDGGLKSAQIPDLSHINITDWTLPIDLLGHKGEFKFISLTIEGMQQFGIHNLTEHIMESTGEHYSTYQVMAPSIKIEGKILINLKGDWSFLDNYKAEFKVILNTFVFNGILNVTQKEDYIHLNDYAISNMDTASVEVLWDAKNPVKDALISTVISELIKVGAKCEMKNQLISYVVFHYLHEIVMNKGRMAAIVAHCKR